MLFRSFIGMIHPKHTAIIDKKCGICTCEIDFTELITIPKRTVMFENVSKYPQSELDFNFLVDKHTLYSEIETIAKSIKSDLQYKVSLLDIFDNGNDSISYTLHYVIGRDDRTLTGEEIENFHKLVIDTFASNNISLKL